MTELLIAEAAEDDYTISLQWYAQLTYNKQLIHRPSKNAKTEAWYC